MGRKNLAGNDEMDRAALLRELLAELVPMREVLTKLPPNLYGSRFGPEWAYRMHRQRFIAAGAVFLINKRRLLVHPQRFARVALEIGAEELTRRHGETVTLTA